MTINTEYCNVREHTLYRMHFVANSYNSLKHLVTQILVTQCLKHETICYNLYPDFGRPNLDSTTPLQEEDLELVPDRIVAGLVGVFKNGGGLREVVRQTTIQFVNANNLIYRGSLWRK